jgi:hypothetical protein
MFGSAILDSAIGVIFGFLAISLFTSAIVEAIQSFFKMRAMNLRGGIKQLLNDPSFGALARKLYQHALISPFGPGAAAPNADAEAVVTAENAYRKRANLPSYIDKAQFARAFLDVTKATPRIADLTKAIAAAQTLPPGAPDPVAPAVAALKAEIANIPSVQIRDFLSGVVDRAGGDAEEIEKQIADWFDASMDRLSGAFKRRSQAWTFAIALVLAVIVNIDSIHIGRQIWAHPELARNLPLAELSKAKIDDEVGALDKVESWLGGDFPVGWPAGTPFEVLDVAPPMQPVTQPPDGAPVAPARSPRPMTTAELGSALLGWLITAFAALFGAPFWFDTLQSLVRLKGSGPSPEEKVKGTAASA